MWKGEKSFFKIVFFVFVCFYFICWKDGVAQTSSGHCCRKASWDNGWIKSLVSDILSFRCIRYSSRNVEWVLTWKMGIWSLDSRFRLKIECGNHTDTGTISSRKFGERRSFNEALGHFNTERRWDGCWDGAASAQGNQETLVNPSQERASRR